MLTIKQKPEAHVLTQGHDGLFFFKQVTAYQRPLLHVLRHSFVEAPDTVSGHVAYCSQAAQLKLWRQWRKLKP